MSGFYNLTKEEANAIMCYANLNNLQVSLSLLPKVKFKRKDGEYIEIDLHELVEDYRRSF